MINARLGKKESWFMSTVDQVKGVLEAISSGIALVALIGGMPVYKQYKKRLSEEQAKAKASEEAIAKIGTMVATIESMASTVAGIDATQKQMVVSQDKIALEVSRLSLFHDRDFNNSTTAYWECNVDGYCTRVNKAWEHLFDLTSDKAIGKGWQLRLVPADRLRVWESWKDAINKGVSWADTYSVMRGNGSVVRCIAQAQPLKNSTGEVMGYIGSTEAEEDLGNEHAA